MTSLTIFLQCPNIGNTLQLHCDTAYTIGEVMDDFSEASGLERDRIGIHRIGTASPTSENTASVGRVLREDATLGELGVVDNDVLLVSVKFHLCREHALRVLETGAGDQV